MQTVKTDDTADVQADRSRLSAHMQSCRKCCAPAHIVFSFLSISNQWNLWLSLVKSYVLTRYKINALTVLLQGPAW